MKKLVRIPFDFVLERLESCCPVVRPMFGCHAVYVGERIVLMLRNKENHREDNGIWLAIAPEHQQALKKIFPALRCVRLLGEKASAWQNIPAEADDFEESALAACDMILKNDLRIGKVPKRKGKPTRAVTKR